MTGSGILNSRNRRKSWLSLLPTNRTTIPRVTARNDPTWSELPVNSMLPGLLPAIA